VVSSLLDQPAVVILAAAGSAIFLLLEVALPTVGLAGTTGLALGALAAWGVDRQDADWWPLLGVVAAIVVWGVLIAMHRRSVATEAVAAALFLAGGLGYALATDDWSAALTALLATAVLALAYPVIARGAARLTGAPPTVGIDSYVGAIATVTDWEAGRGTVVLAGSRWSATGPADLSPGEEVVVVNTSGLSFQVDAVGSRHADRRSTGADRANEMRE
jgi:membrane-bound ClpP family serine protease